jgi:PLP dependent protein
MFYGDIMHSIDGLLNQGNIYPSVAKSCHLVAVSKQQPLEKIEKILHYGHRIFGENRVQEALEKWPAIRITYSDVELHMIGHVQTNKVEHIVELFDVVESLDSEKLMYAFVQAEKKIQKNLRYFIQVNVGNEPQKSGILLSDVEGFYYKAKENGLAVEGLMCIPPVDKHPAPYFVQLHLKAKQLGLTQLSMGMSADYQEAIRLGATYVRIGTALFGERH